MELDDLKEKWKSTTFQSPFELKDSLEQRITAIEHSGRGIRRVFMIEMIIVAAIYAGFILMVWFMAESVTSYMYKLVVITGVATIPISWRMYKSQRWINSMDYTKDVRSNMVGFLHYYKVTLRLYQWSTYVTVVVILVLMFTDDEFRNTPSGAKVTLVIYLVALAALTEPYIRIVYGRRIAVFEKFLND
jgi:hypothetical protein